MATAIQRRRGTSAQHANFTGLAGEITIDTTLNTIIVHDGVTQGGVRLAKYTEVVSASEGDITAVNTIAGGGLTGGTTSGAANIAIDYENMQGNLVPSVDNVYSLGSEDRVWKDVYVGPGSLYVNGQKVLEDNSGTIVVSADEGQNLAMNTKGGGDIEFNAVGGGTITLKSNVVLASGVSFSSAGGAATGYNSNINMSNNQINNVGTPVDSADAANKEYVDTDETVVRVTGDQSIAGAKTFSDDVTVNGSLTVSGTVTTVNSETISLADNLIDLNSNFTTGTPSENAGFRILRGDEAAVQIRWNEADNAWEFTNDGSTYKAMASTQDAREALSVSGDLGYDSATGVVSFTERTDAEVRGLVSADGDLAYNSTTGVVSFTERTESEVRSLFTANGDMSYDSATGIFSYETPTTIASLSNHTTSALSEGDNLYYTPARARGAVSASGDLSYNSTTGVFSFTERTDAEVRGLVSVSGDLSYDSATGVVSFTERTDAEVRGLVSVSGDLSYDSATGVISYTTPTERTDAEVRGLISGGTGISYNSTTGAVSVDSTIATKQYADNAATTAVSAVIDTAPDALNTLNEIAAALGDDENFATTITTSIGTKLASADFTSTANTWIGTKDTDDLAEGSTNLYFTDARADARIAAADTDDLSEGSSNLYHTTARARASISAGGDLAYNSTTGVVSFTERTDAEVRGLVSASGDLSYNSTTGAFSVTTYKSTDFDTDFSAKDTGDLAEGTNLYHTTARARSSISASGDLSYNSTTGVVSYTTPTTIASLSNHDTGDLAEGTNLYYTDARARGAINAGTGISYNSTTGAVSVDSTIATKSYADTAASSAVSAVIDAAPGTLDTLNELAAALGDDANFATTVTDSLATKYDSADFNGDFDARFSSKSTSDLAEGSNLYHTTARVRGAVSASGDLNYNSSTGVFSISLPASDNYQSWSISDGSNTEAIGSGSFVKFVGSGATATSYDSATNTLTISSTDTNTDTNYYLSGLSFNTTSGVLTATRSGLTNLSVDLDGRYQLAGSYQAAGSYVTTDSAQALAASNAIEVSNDTITINKGDGTSESVTISDATLSTEQVQDIVGAMFQASGASSVSYDDAAGKVTVSSTDTNTNTWRGIDDTPVNGQTSESISSNWAYDHQNTTGVGVHGSTTTASANRLAHRDGSGNLAANVFAGTASSARYADLAEKYATDAEYAPGTVVVFGGDEEVTACTLGSDHAVAGVISTDPAYMMNSEAEGQYVALAGRVPCKVTGPVAKGDLMVSSDVAGHAKADNSAQAGRIIGKAISSFDGEGEGVVEVLVNMM